MGYKRHGGAKTTLAERKKMMGSDLTPAELSRKYGVSKHTAKRWKYATTIYDKPSGPKEKHSKVITREQEQACVDHRLKTGDSIDKTYLYLRKTIPNLSRDIVYRTFKRHGVNKRPKKKKERKNFKQYDPGFVHGDITQMLVSHDKVKVFLAIDRVTKFMVLYAVASATAPEACRFLDNVVASFPYKIHTVLTDNGAQFTNRGRSENPRRSAFDFRCEFHGIEHRLTPFFSPQTNGQVERMNRTLKEESVKKFFYETPEELIRHLQAIVDAHNYATELKALNWKTPYEAICDYYKVAPKKFKYNPVKKIPQQYNH